MAKKRLYPRNQTWVDKEGITHSNKEQFEAHKQKSVGTAYAFFDADASLETLTGALSNIREEIRTPQGLELLLYENNSQVNLPTGIREGMEKPGKYVTRSQTMRTEGYSFEPRPLSALKYVMTARYEGATNETAAEELDKVVGDILQHNDNQDVYWSEILYEREKGEYVPYTFK